jgi:probable HAF family extracellular repeat protein
MLVRKSSGLGLAVAFTLMATCAAAHAQSYSLTVLGSLGGQSSAYGVNNAGQVVGYSYDASGVDQHAVLWQGGTVTDLGLGAAHAIGGTGLIGGAGVNQAPTVWQNGTATALDAMGGVTSDVTALNNAGQVAGDIGNGNLDYQAVVWNGTTPTVLAGLGGSSAQAFGINNLGQVSGYAADASGTFQPVIWNGTTATVLDTTAGNGGVASAINDHGVAVGVSMNSGLNFQAVAWNGSTTPTELSLLGGAANWAFAVNNNGIAVGYYASASGEGGTYGALWDLNTGTAIDLNSYLSPELSSAGWVLNVATGINDQGLIVGSIHNVMTGADAAYVMTPVPEPANYALFLIGLCGLGLAVRRRKAA